MYITVLFLFLGCTVLTKVVKLLQKKNLCFINTKNVFINPKIAQKLNIAIKKMVIKTLQLKKKPLK